MISKNFGKTLKAIRCSKGVAQMELGNQTYISKIETGERFPRLDEVDDFAAILQVPASVLLGLEVVNKSKEKKLLKKLRNSIRPLV